jgi:ribosomal protein S18 acetylase RimI-like enzyme
MNVRKALHTDIDGMIPLLKDLFSIEADFSFNETLRRQGLHLMLENPEIRCVMVAEDQSRIIGMASVQILISTAEGGPVGLVEDVVVASEYRRKGIGKQMVDEIENWAKSEGLKRLQLLADKENAPALECYQRLEWTSTQLICLRKKL